MPKLGGADLVGELAQDRLGQRGVLGGEREADVGVPLGAGVLDDHVDVDAGVRERPEDARRDARLVGHADDRHLRFPGVVCDAGDDCLFEHVLLLHDPRAPLLVEGRADVELHSVVASVLDRAQHQHARA